APAVGGRGVVGDRHVAQGGVGAHVAALLGVQVGEAGAVAGGGVGVEQHVAQDSRAAAVVADGAAVADHGVVQKGCPLHGERAGVEARRAGAGRAGRRAGQVAVQRAVAQAQHALVEDRAAVALGRQVAVEGAADDRHAPFGLVVVGGGVVDSAAAADVVRLLGVALDLIAGEDRVGDLGTALAVVVVDRAAAPARRVD